MEGIYILIMVSFLKNLFQLFKFLFVAYSRYINGDKRHSLRISEQWHIHHRVGSALQYGRYRNDTISKYEVKVQTFSFNCRVFTSTSDETSRNCSQSPKFKWPNIKLKLLLLLTDCDVKLICNMLSPKFILFYLRNECWGETWLTVTLLSNY